MNTDPLRHTPLLRARTLRIGAIAVSFGALFGFSTAVIAGVLEDVTVAYGLSTKAAEFMVTALVIGAFVGACSGGGVTVRLGRKKALLVAAIGSLVGYGLILGGAYHYRLGFIAFVAARVLIGLGVGLSSTVAPMYVAETAHAHHRGSLVALFQLAVTAGILLAYVAAWAAGPAVPWQVVLGSGAVIALFSAAATLAVPESPRWVLRRGEKLRALEIARRLGLADELERTDSAPTTRAIPGGLRRRIGTGSTGAVLVLCGLLFVFQNLSGIDGILYYAPRIFSGLGFPTVTAALAATVGLGAVNLGATFGSLWLVDRLGRRPLLIWGPLVMAAGLSLVVLGGWRALPWLGLAGLCVYLSAFAVSLGPLPYVLMAELVPGPIRDAGIAAASATSWLFNALVAFTFLTVVDAAGLAATFGCFMVICIASTLLAVWFVPETKGAALERIEANVLTGRALRGLGGSA